MNYFAPFNIIHKPNIYLYRREIRTYQKNSSQLTSSSLCKVNFFLLRSFHSTFIFHSENQSTIKSGRIKIDILSTSNSTWGILRYTVQNTPVNLSLYRNFQTAELFENEKLLIRETGEIKNSKDNKRKREGKKGPYADGVQ